MKEGNTENFSTRHNNMDKILLKLNRNSFFTLVLSFFIIYHFIYLSFVNTCYVLNLYDKNQFAVNDMDLCHVILFSSATFQKELKISVRPTHNVFNFRYRRRKPFS
jgi:hypothetical protein